MTPPYNDDSYLFFSFSDSFKRDPVKAVVWYSQLRPFHGAGNISDVGVTRSGGVYLAMQYVNCPVIYDPKALWVKSGQSVY
jgi:hypothetical protein